VPQEFERKSHKVLKASLSKNTTRDGTGGIRGEKQSTSLLRGERQTQRGGGGFAWNCEGGLTRGDEVLNVNSTPTRNRKKSGPRSRLWEVLTRKEKGRLPLKLCHKRVLGTKGRMTVTEKSQRGGQPHPQSAAAGLGGNVKKSLSENKKGRASIASNNTGWEMSNGFLPGGMAGLDPY